MGTRPGSVKMVCIRHQSSMNTKKWKKKTTTFAGSLAISIRRQCTFEVRAPDHEHVEIVDAEEHGEKEEDEHLPQYLRPLSGLRRHLNLICFPGYILFLQACEPFCGSIR